MCDRSLATVPATQTWFTFTPTPGVLHYLALKAISGAKKSNSSTELKVSIPAFPQPPTQKSTINVPITPFNPGVTDPDGGKLQYSHAGLPLGLSLNPATGLISGTPTAVGSYNVTISVFDGLVTVLRSFVWTIGDVTPPTLVVTSHVTGQTVSSTSVTLRGTATDFGAGGSGVSSVAINGSAASGGSATGNGIANWSQILAPSAGANNFTIRATDGAGNVRTTQLTLHVGSSAPGGAMSGASLSASRSSPQSAGTPITFTASGAGGVAPYQYQWFVQQNGGAWQLLRSWSTTTTYTWIPSQSGNYAVAVWARSAGATANAWQAYAERSFVINTGTSSGSSSLPVRLTGLTSNLSSPQNTGTAITFTTAVSGGVAPHQFKWWLYDGSTWTVLQSWSTSNTFTWRPTQPNANYIVGVWVRNATTTADVNEGSLSLPFVITTAVPAGPVAGPPTVGPLRLTGLTSSLPSPQATGTSITFTTGSTGGTGPHQFKWWLYNGSTWTVVQNWSTSKTYIWRPTQANPGYMVGVWVRNATTTADANEGSLTIPYAIMAPAASAPAAPVLTGPLTITGLSSNIPSPQLTGTSITFTVSVSGGTAPHQFKWWIYNGSTWTVAQNWSTSKTFNWRPIVANPGYMVGVWVRNATTTADVNEASLSRPYAIDPMP